MGSLEVTEDETVTAFAAFYRAHATASLRLAFLLVGESATAEEITQEAFVAVFERFSTIREPVSYLRSCIVHAAGRRARRDHLFRRAIPLLRGPAATVDDYSDFAEITRRLSPRQRTALFLRYYLDLPETQIAEVMGCRPGTVKSTLHTALRRLGDLLS